MPLAKEIAAELRKVADALDLNPEVNTITPDLTFWYGSGSSKEQFIATARIIPRPVKKNYPKDNQSYSRVSVDYITPALKVSTSIYRETICRIVKPAQPAEYDCELTLLDHEDAELESK